MSAPRGRLDGARRAMALPHGALSVDLFRLLAGLFLATHHARLASEGLPLVGAELLPGVAWSVRFGAWLTLGSIASLLVIAGAVPRAAAATATIAAVALRRELGGIGYFGDYLAVLAALWLVLLPIGTTLRAHAVFADQRSLPEIWQGWRERRVSAAPVRLFLLGLGLLYADRTIWLGSMPGWEASALQHALLAAGPLFALLPAARWWAVAVHLAAHGQLILGYGPALELLFLSSVAVLYPGAAAASAGGAPVALDRAVPFAALYVGASCLVWLGQVGAGAAVSAASAALLADAGLAAPPRRSSSPADPRPLSIGLAVAAGVDRRAPGALRVGGLRTAFVLANVRGAPWSEPAATRKEGFAWRQRLANHLCRAGAAPRGTLASLTARADGAAAAAPLEHLRWQCPDGVSAVVLPSDTPHEGALLAASDARFEPPRGFPVWRDADDLVAAESCAACHAAIHAAWRTSRHARTLRARAPTADAARAARPYDDGLYRVALTVAGSQPALAIEQGGQRRIETIDLVLGSGRREQAFFTQAPDGSYGMLPVLWSRAANQLIATRDYCPDAYDPESDPMVERPLLEPYRCVECHSSDVRLGGRIAADEGVGCEACHGPGREHVEHHTHARGRDPYRDGRLTREDGTAVCAGCHALPQAYAVKHAAAHAPERFAVGMEDARLRADASPELPSYELAAFQTSACHLRGGATCTSCHAAHGPTEGAGATGAACVGCHSGLAERRAQRAHARHASPPACVACHMPERSLRPALATVRTDHSISIPRPAESHMRGERSACAGCHADRDESWALERLRAWGASRATERRAWVEALHAAKDRNQRSEEPSRRLAALLASDADDVPHIARVSALRLLRQRKPDAHLVPLLATMAQARAPDLRAAALDALATHDSRRRASWLAAGSADPHPLVRLELGARRLGLDDRSALDERSVRRYLHDVLNHALRPPTWPLLQLVSARQVAGELQEALALLRLAQRYAAPAERPALHARAQQLGSDMHR